MKDREAHLSDEELVLTADGELSAHKAGEVRRHLAACWTCRTRLQEMEAAVGAFVREYRASLENGLPAAAASRSLLQARLAAQTALQSTEQHSWLRSLTAGAIAWRAAVASAILAACTFAILGVYQHRSADRPAYVPSRRLTPGVARVVDRGELCNSELPKNQAVTADTRRRVFEVYGLANADPRAYEVDYLITPALGGADDIRNLWPQPYMSTTWNAQVKDALEDRLRDMVCRGQVGLADAQRDISTDWVAAYKKYFGATEPLR